jgi:hypothetical protein
MEILDRGIQAGGVEPMLVHCLKVGRRLRWIFFVGVVAAWTVLFGQNLPTPQDWANAAKKIKRLPPSAFKELPPEIVGSLQASGCLIPQPDPLAIPSLGLSPPYNVIRGEFAQEGQEDWAVLCSRQVEMKPTIEWHRTSKDSGETVVHTGKVWKSIVMFFYAKPTNCPSRLDLNMEDQAGLEGIVNGRIGYTFAIKTAGEKEIQGALEQKDLRVEPPPPEGIHHDGVVACDKLGEIYYCQGGRWRLLFQGD